MGYFLFIGLGFNVGSSTVYAADADYLAQLIAQAETQQLASRPEWLKLLHYKPGWLPGRYTSQVDAPEYFNALDGKTNPAAELEATLAGFFTDMPEDKDAQQLHPQCLFTARYSWLKQQLNFDAQRLTEQHCWRFEEWMQAINPAGMTLIFPTAYINSPASMFGHTLVRIDTKAQAEQTSLLAYALNFAADTGNDGGFAYAIKGLMGGYPGGFSVMPYYLKVREYSDMENRDIWEYKLALTEAETRTVLRHAWELRGIWFRYFFFNENCSYHLLSLLETARPDLQLTDQFGAWAIPSDTVRVVEQAGLVDDVIYRPSRHTKLQYQIDQLDSEQIVLAKQLAGSHDQEPESGIAHLALPDQAEVLDVAHEISAYKYKDETEQRHQLLAQRSRLQVSSQEFHVPAGERPDKGHATGRVTLIAGREDGNGYQELELRPAYHDILDASPGYAAGAQIEFFNLLLRHNNHESRLRIQSFKPIDILSITPVDDISRPTSWQFNFGLVRKHGQVRQSMIGTVNGGAGLSLRPFEKATLYALLGAGIDINQDVYDNGYAVGLGPTLGFTTEIASHWALHLYATGKYYSDSEGNDHREKEYALDQRFGINADNSLRLRWAHQQQLADEFMQVNLSWQRYF